jgi:hypothetical protein
MHNGYFEIDRQFDAGQLSVVGEMKTLTGSDDPQSLLVGRNWNLCVDRTGRGYSVTVQSCVLGLCCYPTEQFCPQRFYLT